MLASNDVIPSARYLPPSYWQMHGRNNSINSNDDEGKVDGVPLPQPGEFKNECRPDEFLTEEGQMG